MRRARHDLASHALRYELLEDLAAGEERNLAWTRKRGDECGRFELHGLCERDGSSVLLEPGGTRAGAERGFGRESAAHGCIGAGRR